MARIIYANGTEVEVMPKNGTDFQLEELKAVVRGYIEAVYLVRPGEDPTTHQIMWVNEDGKREQLPLNQKATEIFRQATGDNTDFIVGDVLICDYDQVE